MSADVLEAARPMFAYHGTDDCPHPALEWDGQVIHAHDTRPIHRHELVRCAACGVRRLLTLF